MSEKVVQFPIIPRRYPPHMSLLERLRRDRQTSKEAVQEMTNKFCADTWRGDKFADARLFVDRLLSHPLGGKQWVLKCLEDLRQYVEKR